MNSADHECSYQKGGHAPEGIEQEGVLLGIVVGRVREVPGEAARGSRVALAACGHHVSAAEMGARIGDLRDIVSAVAVVTLGRLGVPQPRNLAVVSIEICLRNFGVAAAA